MNASFYQVLIERPTFSNLILSRKVISLGVYAKKIHIYKDKITLYVSSIHEYS